MFDAEIGFHTRLIRPTTNYFHLQRTDVKSMHSELTHEHVYISLPLLIFFKNGFCIQRDRDERVQIFIEINETYLTNW